MANGTLPDGRPYELEGDNIIVQDTTKKSYSKAQLLERKQFFEEKLVFINNMLSLLEKDNGEITNG
jgi:hypothetical protein